METPKGQNDQSFVAVDQFEFLQISACDILPAQAAPTPAPTEPPGRKFSVQNSLLISKHSTISLFQPLLSVPFKTTFANGPNSPVTIPVIINGPVITPDNYLRTTCLALPQTGRTKMTNSS